MNVEKSQQVLVWKKNFLLPTPSYSYLSANSKPTCIRQPIKQRESIQLHISAKKFQEEMWIYKK